MFPWSSIIIPDLNQCFLYGLNRQLYPGKKRGQTQYQAQNIHTFLVSEQVPVVKARIREGGTYLPVRILISPSPILMSSANTARKINKRQSTIVVTIVIILIPPPVVRFIQ